MKVKLIECPRDAMQGIHEMIPTAVKTAYLNTLLQVGFDTLDFGSFVSAKAIPQLADTEAVLDGLNLEGITTKLLAITANTRGAERACSFKQIQYIGFPFSISETFQLRNTNSTIVESMNTVREIRDLCEKAGKELVLYISMGFGNPYGDIWSPELVEETVHTMVQERIQIISLSDTVGVANEESIEGLFSYLIPRFQNVEFGAHLHTTPNTWREKVDAAYRSGCKRFDGALKGFGGCPMASDKLTGNMPTENLLAYLLEKGIDAGIKHDLFNKAMLEASNVFPLN